MDNAALRRLAEIGIDVYVPRRADAVPPTGIGGDPVETAPPRADGTVVLVADLASPRAVALVGAVERALAFARVACRRAGAADEAAFSTARALVAFGDAHARAAGRALSAQRQQDIVWVVTGEPAALAADAPAKRALWSELRRLLRSLRAADGR